MENVDGVNGIVIEALNRPYAEVKKGYTYFEENDVIFAKITPCMQNGKNAIVTGLIDGIGFGSTEFHVIRCSEEVIPEWIHLFLRRQETLDAAIKTFYCSSWTKACASQLLRKFRNTDTSIS